MPAAHQSQVSALLRAGRARCGCAVGCGRRRRLVSEGSADHLISAWDVAQTGGYFAGNRRLAASDLAVGVSSPTAQSELRALVDDATEHSPVCQAIRGNVAINDCAFHLVRRHFDVQAFGVNAATGNACDEMVEEHHEADDEENQTNGHQEPFAVMTGHAVFTVDGDEIDAPAGTIVFVRDPGLLRAARATADDTAIFMAGGPAGVPHPFLVEPGPIAFAHRGGAGEAPENTLVAFEIAAALGYAYLETDVHLSRRRVNIDPKSDPCVAPLAGLLDRLGAWDRVCVGSFSDRRVRRIRALGRGRACKSIGAQAVAFARLTTASAVMRRLGADCIQVPIRERPIRMVTGRFMSAAHGPGLSVPVWTINDETTINELLDLGVDGLMSDRLRLLKGALTRHRVLARR